MRTAPALVSTIPSRLQAAPTTQPTASLLVNGGLDQAKLTSRHASIPAAMAPETCPACLDLDHDTFAATPGLEGDDDQSLQLYPLPRYRIVPRREVAAAADADCCFCHVLREGMLHFWGDQAPQAVDLLPHGIDLDDLPHYGDDEIQKLHHNI